VVVVGAWVVEVVSGGDVAASLRVVEVAGRVPVVGDVPDEVQAAPTIATERVTAPSRLISRTTRLLVCGLGA
jgi:hypothetical protein